jgi:hypothetical protein
MTKAELTRRLASAPHRTYNVTSKYNSTKAEAFVKFRNGELIATVLFPSRALVISGYGQRFTFDYLTKEAAYQCGHDITGKNKHDWYCRERHDLSIQF